MKRMIRTLEQTAWALFLGCICTGLLGLIMAILGGISMMLGANHDPLRQPAQASQMPEP